MASSSLSNVLYRVIFFEKNAMGCHEEPMYLLLKCCPDSVVGGVCHETRGGVQLWVSEECGVSKNFLHLAESRKGLLSPFDVGGLVLGVCQQLVEGMHDGCTRRQETAIKVHQADELLQLALGGGLWKGTDGLNLVLHRPNALAADEMSKEIERYSTPKMHLLGLCSARCCRTRRRCRACSSVLWRTGYQKVIDVPIAEIQPVQNLIHNVCPAFRRPNSMRVNPNSPNGVITAVLGISSGSTGIWWYTLTRSSLLKIVAPWREAMKSCKRGMGQRSGTVLWLSAQ